MSRFRILLGTSLAMSLAACGSGNNDLTSNSSSTQPVAQAGAYDTQLAFDVSSKNYTTISVNIDGTPTNVRWYKDVCYVAKPMPLSTTASSQTTYDNTTCGFQNMSIFVREDDANRHDNAILLNVNNSGWLASYVGSKSGGATYSGASISAGKSYVSTSDSDKVGAALSRHMVFINIASRSRGAVAAAGAYADGPYQGKSPAAIVDAKAAVRYLRLNKGIVPGNPERIFVNGTSGGGAQSTQLGATGNNSDYFPYLQAAGAAGITADGKSTISDNVFAIVAYCPIQDLGSADLAYEWQFNVLNTRALVSQDQLANKIVSSTGAALIRASNPNAAASSELMGKYSAYLANLGLKNDDGTTLTTDNMLAEIQNEIKKAASKQVKAGKTFVAYGATGTAAANGVGGGSGTLQYTNDYMNVDASGNVTFFNMSNYLKFVAEQARLKAVPAFDQEGQTAALAATVTTDGAGTVNNTGGESNLFGTPAQIYSNFTEYAWMHNDMTTGSDYQGDVGYANTGFTWDANPQKAYLLNQYKMVNALAYVGKTDGITTHWRIRVGARDRDTAFTVAYNLSRALKADQKVSDVDYALQWDQGHAGDYDVQDAFTWIDSTLAAAK